AVCLVMAIAFYRLQDLLFSSLDNALDLTGERDYEGFGFDSRSPVLIALVNLIQVIVIFGIAYFELARHPRDSFFPPVSGRFSYFLVSWHALPPLGSGGGAKTLMPLALSITESGVALILGVIA